MQSISPHEASALIKRLATETGFDLVGIARAEPSSHPDAYRNWIAAGKHGAMSYLEKNVEERIDITKKFPWAKSILCLALAYFQESPAPDNTQTPTGKIARYAWGRDYHKVMENKLRHLEKKLRESLEENSNLIARSYVDTGPILEREFAARAGLGWIGKNTLLIHPYQGSWFLLAELITNLDLTPDSPITDHCGTCTRCIDACPTQAITPYSVHATRCISYLTLEDRGTIGEEFHEPIRQSEFILGCDICQEVCPYNRQPIPTNEPDFIAKKPAPHPNLTEILQWQEAEWDALTRGRAFRRAKLPMWQRNAKIILHKTQRDNSSK